MTTEQCHASHEACELKFWTRQILRKTHASRLAWGVWVEIFAFSLDFFQLPTSRLAWGVWVEITPRSSMMRRLYVTPRMRRVSWNKEEFLHYSRSNRHASHEACELKSKSNNTVPSADESRLAWGVWVEIGKILIFSNQFDRHASHEACELKFSCFSVYTVSESVTPRMRRVSWNICIMLLVVIVI